MDKKRVLYGRFGKLFFLLHDPLAYCMGLFTRQKVKKAISENPKILLCCWASLGDVVLATSVIPHIKKRYPLATIGFLCAPGSFAAIEKNGEITHVHKVPSWMVLGQNRLRNLCTLTRSFFTVYRKVVREIQSIGYDIGIELHPFFPNTIALMHRAKIPKLIGFTSGGYDLWLTDPVSFPKDPDYLPLLYPLLLEKIGVEAFPSPSFVTKSKKSKKIVLHPGTSDPRKLWGADSWKALANGLQKLGYELVITGKGEKERAFIEESGLTLVGENLCDRLDFPGLCEAIKQAALVISIDSLPVHLAASLHVPFIGLYLYNANVELWLPNASDCYLFIHNRCRRISEQKHPRALYLEEVYPEDVLSCARKLLGGTV